MFWNVPTLPKKLFDQAILQDRPESPWHPLSSIFIVTLKQVVNKLLKLFLCIQI